jgi:hypothetical protein
VIYKAAALRWVCVKVLWTIFNRLHVGPRFEVVRYVELRKKRSADAASESRNAAPNAEVGACQADLRHLFGKQALDLSKQGVCNMLWVSG